VHVYLPIAAEAVDAVSDDRPSNGVAIAGGRETLLIAEDGRRCGAARADAVRAGLRRDHRVRRRGGGPHLAERRVHLARDPTS